VATLETVAAGFSLVPSRDREREYLRYYVGKEQFTLPLEGALFELRLTREDVWVVLLPLRSFDTAKRIQKAFEQAAKDHQAAMKARGKLGPA
jgi:hypothetical protein